MYVLTNHCINPIIQCKTHNRQRVTHSGQWQWPSLMFIWKLIHTWSLLQLAILLCLEVWGALTNASRLLSNFPTFQSAWRQFEILLESPGNSRATQLLFWMSCDFFQILFYSFYFCIRITWKCYINRRLLVLSFVCQIVNRFSVIRPNSHRVIGSCFT